MQIKVIIEDGIVRGVLKNKDDCIDVEIIATDGDYEDYEQLEAYAQELFHDPAYQECNYTVAHFDVDDEEGKNV